MRRRTIWVVIWTAIFGFIYWLASGFLQDFIVNWAKTAIQQQAGKTGLSLAPVVLWLYDNPIWTVSGFVGIYAIGLLSLLLFPILLEHIRSRGIQLNECFVQREKQFFNDQTRQLLAIGDVAVAEIINNGLPAVIIPEIRSIDMRSKTLTLVGRWTDSELPRDRQAAVRAINIGTGERRLLDVGVRFAGDGELWFALDNNNSPFAAYRFQDYDLISPIIAHVIINGNIENKIIRREWFILLISNGSANIAQISKRAARRLIRGTATLRTALA